MKKRFLVFVVLFTVTLFNIAARNKATISKKDGHLFWELTGVDKNGIESKVYILGTFHIGDERLYPLPQYILDYFDNADVICGEVSSEGWDNFQSALTDQMLKDMIVPTEKQVFNFLTEDELNTVYNCVGAQAQYLFSFKPWVLNQLLSSVKLGELDFEFVDAYDRFFINRAEEAGRHMDGLDELSVQVECLAYGDFDFQLENLKETISSIDDIDDEQENFIALYEAYLSGDEKIMTEAYFEQLKREIFDVPGLNDYYEALLKNRNIVWAKEIDNYLYEGGATFIFAGTGHFIGEDSVFNFMRANGTLE